MTDSSANGGDLDDRGPRHWWQFWRSTRTQEAERRKLASHITVLRERAERFRCTKDTAVPAHVIARVGDLLSDKNWCKDKGEDAYAYADRLAELLPLIASKQYLCTALEFELGEEAAAAETIKLADVLDEATLLRIRNGLPRLDRDSQASITALDQEEMAETLSLLYRTRANRGRHERLMANLRPRYLSYLVVSIIGLLALLAAAILLGGATNDGLSLVTWGRLLLVGAGGALGSVLAATDKLRDVAELNSFRGVVRMIFIQPLVGASLGVMSWLILISGVVTIAGNSNGAWATQAVVAFASGFSEPVFLGIVGKVMGPSQ